MTILQIQRQLLLSVLIPILVPGNLHADNQSHESIYQAVTQHIQHRLLDVAAEPRIDVKELDRRRVLSQCEIPLETYDPPSFRNLGRSSVGIRCKGAQPWALYVSVTVSADLPVVVAAHPLSRGAILQPGDLDLRITNSDRLYADYLTRLDQAVGKRLRRNIGGGTTINNGMLLTPKAVKYGNLVTLVTRAGGLEVRMKGKAVGQGGIGERVAVQNLSSKRKVEGIIRSAGLVEVQ